MTQDTRTLADRVLADLEREYEHAANDGKTSISLPFDVVEDIQRELRAAAHSGERETDEMCEQCWGAHSTCDHSAPAPAAPAEKCGWVDTNGSCQHPVCGCRPAAADGEVRALVIEECARFVESRDGTREHLEPSAIAADLRALVARTPEGPNA